MPNDPRYLSLTDADIEREYWRLHFWGLLQAGGKPGEEILESHGDEAFDEFVKEMEREAEEKAADLHAKHDEFEDVT